MCNLTSAAFMGEKCDGMLLPPFYYQASVKRSHLQVLRLEQREAAGEGEGVMEEGEDQT